MNNGRRRVERIPKAWADQVRDRVRAGREFQDAVRDLLTANAELLVLARKQKLQQP
jgi:small ligand-binding sensory domain FIST